MHTKVLIDEVPLTSIVTVEVDDIIYGFRQLIDENYVIIPEVDYVLHVKKQKVYLVSSAAIDMRTNLPLLVMVTDDGETMETLEINQIRILQRIESFDSSLN